MKVFFDIITNHTADVIGYEEGARTAVRLQGRRAVRTAARHAVRRPRLRRTAAPSRRSTRRRPSRTRRCSTRPSRTVKVPAWLNDPTMYHNRGDSTFTGEDRQYGDFFGLDDLLTENPEVVSGMIDIYKTWVRDFGIDGFRIDTDEARQHRVLAAVRADGPRVRRASTASRDFFMFGEVYSTAAARPSFTSHYTTARRACRPTLDFPFQDAAARLRLRGQPANGARDVLRRRRLVHRRRLQRLRAADLPRQPRHGPHRLLPAGRQPGRRATPSCSPRDQLAHELMYLSRGNPVVYYGDEQGFTGDGGDKDARQDMFASQVGRLPRRRPDRHRRDPRAATTSTRRTRCTGRSPTWPR